MTESDVFSGHTRSIILGRAMPGAWSAEALGRAARLLNRQTSATARLVVRDEAAGADGRGGTADGNESDTAGRQRPSTQVLGARNAHSGTPPISSKHLFQRTVLTSPGDINVAGRRRTEADIGGPAFQRKHGFKQVA